MAASTRTWALSDLVSRLRCKGKSKSKSKSTSRSKSSSKSPSHVQDTRPPLIATPLPLVLAHHQHLLSTLGWTTLTLPPPTPHTPAHPLLAAATALFLAAQRFFDAPDAVKARWSHRLGSEEGWTRIPGEKEFITLRTQAGCPGVLRAAAARYWGLMGAHLAGTLERVSASLGMAGGEGKGLGRFVGPGRRMGDGEGERSATMLRIFRYEGWEAKVVAEPHADLGLLSAVVGDVPGLEVWGGEGWVAVERGYEAGGRQATYTVGRTLERLSNGRYPAGAHRVVSYGAAAPRPEGQPGTGGEGAVEKRYRHSIVFVLRAHEPVVVESAELETEITGRWAVPVSGVTAGKMYEEIRGQHFNINIGHAEREKQRRNVREGKAGGETQAAG
ncbi:hypothetical protein PMIN04_007637 [Paraphaeosphaeria minitans]